MSISYKDFFTATLDKCLTKYLGTVAYSSWHVKLTVPVEIEGRYFMWIGHSKTYMERTMYRVHSEETLFWKKKQSMFHCIIVECDINQINCSKSWLFYLLNIWHKKIINLYFPDIQIGMANLCILTCGLTEPKEVLVTFITQCLKIGRKHPLPSPLLGSFTSLNGINMHLLLKYNIKGG